MDIWVLHSKKTSAKELGLRETDGLLSVLWYKEFLDLSGNIFGSI